MPSMGRVHFFAFKIAECVKNIEAVENLLNKNNRKSLF